MSTFGVGNHRADFPLTAPAANPVFYRTYSRKSASGRESWNQVGERNLEGLQQLGQLNDEEITLLARMQAEKKALPSGRWLWIGGTSWIEKNQNFSGAYNCTSTNLVDWKAFGLMMDLAMMGCGTGAVIEPHLINQLPIVINPIKVIEVTPIGITPKADRQDATTYKIKKNSNHYYYRNVSHRAIKFLLNKHFLNILNLKLKLSNEKWSKKKFRRVDFLKKLHIPNNVGFEELKLLI